MEGSNRGAGSAGWRSDIHACGAGCADAAPTAADTTVSSLELACVSCVLGKVSPAGRAIGLGKPGLMLRSYGAGELWLKEFAADCAT